MYGGLDTLKANIQALQAESQKRATENVIYGPKVWPLPTGWTPKKPGMRLPTTAPRPFKPSNPQRQGYTNGTPMQVDTINRVDDKDLQKYKDEGRCFHCSQQGHMSRQCPKKKKNTPPQKPSYVKYSETDEQEEEEEVEEQIEEEDSSPEIQDMVRKMKQFDEEGEFLGGSLVLDF